MLNKILLLLFLIIYSCNSVGPNYNRYQTHSQEVIYRGKTIHKEDLRVKKTMSKTRRKCKPKKYYIKNKKLKTYIK
jgi:hypothetical protein